MAGTISIKMSDFDGFINAMLNNFTTENIANMKEATKKAASFGTKKVKEEASNVNVGSGEYAHVGLKQKGRYINSWTNKKVNETAYTIEYNVYSKKYYMLTHLLEYGHEKVLFGVRMAGERVRGYPHISIAEKATEDEFVQYVVTGVERYDSI